MANGGGNFNDFNKPLNGVYTRFLTHGQTYLRASRGIVAAGIVSDWSPEDQIFIINKDEFESDPVKVTGYPYTDPHNDELREVFSHAVQLYAYRLNKGGQKAKADGVGEAKYSGSAGNNISVSVLQNVIDETKYDVTTYVNGLEKDLQTVLGKTQKTVSVAKKGNQSNESIDKPSATITAESNVVTVTYSDLVSSYPTTGTKVTKDGQAVEANIDIQSDGLVDTITFQDGTEDGTYKVEAIVKGADEKNLKSVEVTKTTTPETLKLTKGAEEEGTQVESETVDFQIEGLKATLTYASLPEGYTEVKTQVTKDGEPYSEKVSVSNAELVDTVQFESGAPKGAYKIVARIKKTEQEEYSTIKTFNITVETDTPESVDYQKGEDTPGEAPEAPKATIEFANKDVTVSFSDTLVDYPSTVIEVEPTTGANVTSKKVTFTEDAESTDYTIKAYLKKSSAEKKLVATVQATVTVDESGVAGADGSLLNDNNYVVFTDGIIEPNAGYVFEGGTSGDAVTVEDHNAFLNKLEGRSFNELYYGGTDDAVKAVYDEYTHRLRDTRGLYFQTVLSNYANADYEGVISIYNGASGSETVKTPVPWTAGLFSSLQLSQEATNTVYDGLLKIDADISQSKMELLANSGHFFFHQTDIDEVRTYEDVNTLRTFTEEKDAQASQNKVIRIVDYIHNTLAKVCGRLDIGKLTNDEIGRNVLWARVDAVLTELVNVGAIENYTADDIRVLPITGQKNSVEIQLDITVKGTIRKIYITTNIYE